MNQKLIVLKGEKDKYAIIVGDFNTPFSKINEQGTENHQQYRRT